MLDAITKRYTDWSTPDSFAFSFYCDRCDREWRSETFAFNTKGFEQPIDERVRSMLWNKQHDDAFERANREAQFYFNYCPSCGRRVCNSCFYVSETDCTDICTDCLKEHDAA